MTPKAGFYETERLDREFVACCDQAGFCCCGEEEAQESCCPECWMRQRVLEEEKGSAK